jgi:hypothetical protein
MSRSVGDSNSYEIVEKNGEDIESRREVTKPTNTWKATGKHSMTWKNLAWEVDVKKIGFPTTQKKIIKWVSGYVESGSVSVCVQP